MDAAGDPIPCAPLEADYSYDGYGRVWSQSISPTILGGVGGDTFTYGYDAYGQNSLAESPVYTADGNLQQRAITWVKNVQRDLAGRITSRQTYLSTNPNTTPADNYTTETTAWGVNGQMTSQNWSTPWWWDYSYNQVPAWSGTVNYYTGLDSAGHPANGGATNGQMAAMVDGISNETVLYQYDALKRLTSAQAAGWQQTYTYDGFGNLTGKKLNNTTTPIAVNAATNRLGNAGYDFNGNMVSGNGLTMTYDEANRITSATLVSGGTEYYGYAPDNKRVYQVTAGGVEYFALYGVAEEKLEMFSGYNQNLGLSNSWFEGRPVGRSFVTDRLGTNRVGGQSYYPYGEQKTAATIPFLRLMGRTITASLPEGPGWDLLRMRGMGLRVWIMRTSDSMPVRMGGSIRQTRRTVVRS